MDWPCVILECGETCTLLQHIVPGEDVPRKCPDCGDDVRVAIDMKYLTEEQYLDED